MCQDRQSRLLTSSLAGNLLIFFLGATLPAPAEKHPELHWAYQPPARIEPPQRASLKHAERVHNPIDQFVLAGQEEVNLEPAPPAERATLVRRAYFDLLGLPPTPEQVEEFVTNHSPTAWTELIESLLASKHYGERWARHWLDVARYADSGGYETDIYYRNAWRYRDYVVKSFNDDKPYNLFVQEQIAGDELWPDNLDLDPRRVYIISEEKQRHLEARTGTGFYTLSPRVHESGLDAKRLTYETMTDWVDTTASAFLGLTLACARCHDHKFDPFTQRDYFSLQAIFASAKEVEFPVWDSMTEADWRQHYPLVVAVDEARTAHRLFEEQTRGKKLSPEEEQRGQELLAAIGRAVVRLLKGGAGPGVDIPFASVMQIPTVSVLGRRHPALIPAVHLLERGELDKPLQRVEPALPASLAKATNSPIELGDPFESRNKLALWMTRPDHPLTARVMVNRVWQWHFGRGIVATPNDFGTHGEPPTNQALLDWLTTRFVEDGWSIKNLHRLIMNSATYRQTSRYTGARHVEIDPDNKLLWRMPRRRLEAEALWDAVHASAGTLNLAMGGRPVVPPLAADELASLRHQWQWVVSADPAQHTRRGIYILVLRNFSFPMFEVFDPPLNAASCPSREVTTVAPQALWGLNNGSVFRQAVHLAGRVAAEAGAESSAQIDRAWRITLGRAPTAEEVTSALELLENLEADQPGPPGEMPESLAALGPARAQALAKLCLALFNLSEFAFID